MRRLIITSLLLSAFALPAIAAGVLVPKQNDPKAKPYLGLTPRAQDSSATPAAKKSDTATSIINESLAYTPKQSTASGAQTKMPSVQSQQTLESLVPDNIKHKQILNTPKAYKLNPGGTIETNQNIDAMMASLLVDGNSGTQQSSLPPFIERMKKEYLKKYELDTVIMDEIAMPAPPAGDKRITIGIAQKYQWGMQDIMVIAQGLGYNNKEIPSACQLRVDATVETDKDAFSYKGKIMGGTKTAIQYSGKFRKIKLQPMAVCAPPQKALPKNGSLIIQSGGYYNLYLTSGKDCASGITPAPASLLINYRGDKGVICKFE